MTIMLDFPHLCFTPRLPSLLLLPSYKCVFSHLTLQTDTVSNLKPRSVGPRGVRRARRMIRMPSLAHRGAVSKGRCPMCYRGNRPNRSRSICFPPGCQATTQLSACRSRHMPLFSMLIWRRETVAVPWRHRFLSHWLLTCERSS